MSRRRWPGRRNALLLLALAAPACARSAGSATREPATESTAPTTALAVDSALVAIASRPLWPGFAPLSTPVAIFDGTRTWLFRHPSPPADYVAVEGRPDVVARVGRDSVVTANTSARLGGVSTATVMLDARQSARAGAALAIHELFHVFQRARHPGWQANEADLFTYPVENDVALALRREETTALARALGARSVDSVRCWARAFSDVRRVRFGVIGNAAAAYERGTELNEGLAQYVEGRAGMLALDPPAAVVRQRSYDVGAAIGTVLRRLRRDWPDAVERSAAPSPPLDSVLAEVAGSGEGFPACAATPAQRADWAESARREVRTLETERLRARAEFLARPGARLVVDARGAPLFPAGFDPLNVARLTPTSLLHTRFLTLQNAHGKIELLGGAALTEGSVGQHPLFAGVSRVTFAGLATPPAMHDSAGVLILRASGLTARLARARARIAGDTITVTWQ